ncbi:MAG: pantetheine-phosphate adenylyltransferase [Candidatus Omnitrophica bacterium]|nr:pantetheine-phosphate adenylyltransferase [Candidatus Omnitrophota bacterium]
MASKRISRKAVYPGSFDPVTNGHLALIRKAATLFDFLYVAVGSNPTKRCTFSSDERVEMIRRSVQGLSNVEVMAFDGLVVDFAEKKKAQVVIRGLRAVSDYEMELQMALTNKKLNPDIETVFLLPSEEHFYISSGLIKEITRLGGRIGDFVPAHVEQILRKSLAPK